MKILKDINRAYPIDQGIRQAMATLGTRRIALYRLHADKFYWDMQDTIVLQIEHSKKGWP